MKIQFLDLSSFKRGLIPVTSTELKTRSGEFDPEGLFSEKIFGFEGSIERSQKFSYIDLHCEVIHPSGYQLLLRLDKKLSKLFSTEEKYVLQDGKLVESEDGITGITKFKTLFPKIQFRSDSDTRERIIKVVKQAYQEGKLFVSVIPVIPPDFRPMYEDESGNLIIDELNNIYIEILRKARQVKSISKDSPLYDLFVFQMQQVVLKHDQFIRTKISKKTGLLRANLLGKRADFSARGVITPNPNLRLDQIGIPLRMAVSIFQPFLVHLLLFSEKYPSQKREKLKQLVKDYLDSELSVDSLSQVFKAIKFSEAVPKELYDLIFEAAEIVSKDRVVLAKRDPVLHEGSYKAFYPKIVDGHTIQICPLQVGEFNADFDGDQMAIFHPLSNEAQQEAKERLMQLTGGKNFSHIRFEFSKEMLVGLYILTKNKTKKNSPVQVTKEMLETETDPYLLVKYRGKVTTFGRALVNSCFPSDFPFIDKLVTKKVVNNEIVPLVVQKYERDVVADIFLKLEKIGFKFSTIMAPSILIDLFEVPESILRIKEKLDKVSPDEAEKLLKEAEKIMIQHVKDSGLYDLVESGAGKGWLQPRQILVAKGIIADPKGNLLPPIKGSFADGLKSSEYFQAASGARKGMADRALNTAETGYFARQLIYLLSPVELHPSLRDCGTDRTITLRLTNDLVKRLTGRIVKYGDKLTEFDPEKFKVGMTINLRTPIYCRSAKICHVCYGKLLLRHRSPYVGVLAGCSIGERSTQIIMRTFHTGGAASFAQHDILKDIFENDPLINVDLKKYLVQTENLLTATKQCTLTINLSEYKVGTNLQIQDDHVWLENLISKIEFEDTMFNLILDYPVEVKKINFEENKEYLKFKFNPNDTILEIPLSTVEIKEQVSYIKRLLGGKVIYTDPSHLLLKVMKVYAPISNLDLVHFEILVSQVLRDRKNRALPARLGKTWDPVMMNIKQDVFESGFVQALAFENINKAIEVGLISGDDLGTSVLGKLITGEPLV